MHNKNTLQLKNILYKEKQCAIKEQFSLLGYFALKEHSTPEEPFCLCSRRELCTKRVLTLKEHFALWETYSKEDHFAIKRHFVLEKNIVLEVNFTLKNCSITNTLH